MTNGGRIRITLEDLNPGGRSPTASGDGASQTPTVNFGQGNIDHDLPSVMKANRQIAGRSCSLCHSAIEAGQDVRNCEECRLSYHLECWKSNAGCGTYGCPNSPDARQNPVRHAAPLPLVFPPASFSQKLPAGGFQQINVAVAPGNPMMVAPQSTSGMAVAGFVLGLLGFTFAWVPIVGLLLALLGLVFSGTGLSAIRRSGRILGGKGLAVAGLVLSILVVLAYLLLFAIGFLIGMGAGA